MIDKSKSNFTLGFIFVLTAACLYGAMPALSQKCYELGLSVEQVLTGRYFFGTIFIWIFILIKKSNFKVKKIDFLTMLLIGVLIFFCVFFMTSSYYYLPGAIASLIVFSYIIIVNIVEIITKKVLIKPIRILCLILTIIGLVLVIYKPGEGIKLNITGLIFAILAGVLYAFWTMSMSLKRLSNIKTEVMMGYTLLIPTLFNVTKCLMSGYSLFPTSLMGWVFILLLALTPGFIAPILFASSVRILGASTASIINTSEPVFAYFFGLMLMGDVLEYNAFIGGGIIIIGIVLLRLFERKGN